MSALAGVSTQVSGPIAHDNLAVYFVHDAVEGAVPMTLEEALAKGRVKVSETGSVNALTVHRQPADAERALRHYGGSFTLLTKKLTVS